MYINFSSLRPCVNYRLVHLVNRKIRDSNRYMSPWLILQRAILAAPSQPRKLSRRISPIACTCIKSAWLYVNTARSASVCVGRKIVQLFCTCVRQCTTHSTHTHARVQRGAGSNILFSLLGQGGQPCYFDTDINDNVMHRPEQARAFNAITFWANSELRCFDPSCRWKRSPDSC